MLSSTDRSWPWNKFPKNRLKSDPPLSEIDFKKSRAVQTSLNPHWPSTFEFPLMLSKNRFKVAPRLRKNSFLNRVLMERQLPNIVFQIAEKQILVTSYTEMVFILAILKFVWLQYMLVLLRMALEVMLLSSNKDWVVQFYNKMQSKMAKTEVWPQSEILPKRRNSAMNWNSTEKSKFSRKSKFGRKSKFDRQSKFDRKMKFDGNAWPTRNKLDKKTINQHIKMELAHKRKMMDLSFPMHFRIHFLTVQKARKNLVISVTHFMRHPCHGKKRKMNVSNKDLIWHRFITKMNKRLLKGRFQTLFRECKKSEIRQNFMITWFSN